MKKLFLIILICTGLGMIPARGHANWLDAFKDIVSNKGQDSGTDGLTPLDAPVRQDIDIHENYIDPMDSSRLIVTADTVEDIEMWESLWGGIQADWGGGFSEDSVTVHYTDVTCDGRKDYIASRIDRNDQGEYNFFLRVQTRDGVERRYASLQLPYDLDDQTSLCSLDSKAAAHVYYESWAGKDIFRNNKGLICDRAIRIDDGLCDTVTLFWPLRLPQEGEVPLVLYRR